MLMHRRASRGCERWERWSGFGRFLSTRSSWRDDTTAGSDDTHTARRPPDLSGGGETGSAETKEAFPGPPIPLHRLGSTFFFPNKGGNTERAGEAVSPKTTTVRLLGNTVYTLSASAPPLSSAEVERATLARTLFFAPLAPFCLNAEKPALLLSPAAVVHQLGREMEAVDAVFRQKGFYTPSEVAQAFVAVTPTYYVETRHVFAAAPPSVMYALEKRFFRGQLVTHFLQRYPMIFTVKRSKHRKSAVKLNTDMWFIRAHPDYGKGDRLHSKNNAEFNVSMGGVLSAHVPGETPGASTADKDGSTHHLPVQAAKTPAALDAHIVSILTHHLPRVPAAQHAHLAADALSAQRSAPLKLVEWINSFPQEEIDVINGVSQRHVVQLLQRYHGIFQLLCLHGEDPLLFTPHSAYHAVAGSRTSVTVTIDTHPVTTTRPHTATPSEATAPIRAPWEEELDGLVDESFGGNHDAVDDPYATDSGDVSANLDILYVRRRPNHVAPRALSDFDVTNSPLPDIARLAAGFLSLPPSLAEAPPDGHPFVPLTRTLASAPQRFPTAAAATPKSNPRPGTQPKGSLWRWVPLDRIYKALSKAQRQALRPYKGLVNFLRLHGTVFELSEDMRHVIAHDPQGLLAPLVPTQRRFHFESRVLLPDDFDDNPSRSAAVAGERERELFHRVLGHTQIPTTRRQILLLDPHNPVLFHDVLYEEVANTLPPEPVPVRSLLRSLPPVLHAALPHTVNLASSRFFVVWQEKGTTMVQRSDVGKPDALNETPCRPEEAVEAIYAALPDGGVTIRALMRLYLSGSEVAALNAQFGSVLKAVKCFPQFFEVDDTPGTSFGDTLVRPRN